MAQKARGKAAGGGAARGGAAGAGGSGGAPAAPAAAAGGGGVALVKVEGDRAAPRPAPRVAAPHGGPEGDQRGSIGAGARVNGAAVPIVGEARHFNALRGVAIDPAAPPPIWQGLRQI